MCPIYLFQCVRKSTDGSNALSMGLTGGAGWWRGFDGLEQLQLIFKMHLLKTTQKCLAGLNLKECNQLFKAPTASKFQN